MTKFRISILALVIVALTAVTAAAAMAAAQKKVVFAGKYAGNATTKVDGVRDACDLFTATSEASGHADGRVSIEVDPRLAHIIGDIAQAQELSKIVDRPPVDQSRPPVRSGPGLIDDDHPGVVQRLEAVEQILAEPFVGAARGRPGPQHRAVREQHGACRRPRPVRSPRR